MMEYRDQMFQVILADCSISDITEAFIEHVRRKSDLPTPSDIYNIINPPPPKPDWAAYQGLKHQQKQDLYLTPEERKYISWCEAQAIEKKSAWDEKQYD